LQPILERFAKQLPDRYTDNFRVDLRSIIDLYAKPMEAKLYLLFGAVASLLLIGCASVSILLLARGAQRQHELAIRAALGARRTRIIQQLLTESLVIAAAGAALGVLFAWRSLALLIAWVPENSYPAEAVIKMNWPVLFFSVGVAIVTAILCGISPALQLSRPDLGRLMQSTTRRIMGSAHGKRTHSVMVGAQVALTLLILAAAGAAGKGFLRLLHADLGYDRIRRCLYRFRFMKTHTRLGGALRILRADSRQDRGHAAGRCGGHLDECHAALKWRRQPH
jgi:putative ABC transport system permease protein